MVMLRTGHDLVALVGASETLGEVCKADLRPGDCLVIHTCNSRYRMRVLGDGWFEVVGGWFDRKGNSPVRVRVNGCTWGGSILKWNAVAACRLCLEFGNRVVTSPIQRIAIFPHGSLN